MQIHDKYITQDAKRVRTRFEIAESDRSTSYAYDDKIKQFCDFERIDFSINNRKRRVAIFVMFSGTCKTVIKPGAKIE